MRTFKEKHCKFCGELFTPTGSSHKFCTKQHQYLWMKEEGIHKHYRDTFNAKHGVRVGIGSGGTTGVGPKNHMYKHGRDAFRNFARKLKLLGVPCAGCGKDLRDAPRGEWCGHHRDHDDTNNHLNNLVLLCKHCHHMHHEAYRNLPSLKNVQRLEHKLVENSVLEVPEAPRGRDIV
jgi:hypothetical protein